MQCCLITQTRLQLRSELAAGCLRLRDVDFSGTAFSKRRKTAELPYISGAPNPPRPIDPKLPTISISFSKQIPPTPYDVL